VRALILHGPGDLRLEDVADPVAGPGEIVIDVTVALTCATDAKMVRAGAHPALGPLPAPLGHEVVGVVSQAGMGVGWPAVGDAVIVANSAPCLACPQCRTGRSNLCGRLTYLTGAFAERLRVPAPIVSRNTHPLPPGMAPPIAAAAEPLACAVHTANTSRSSGSREVLILGGGVQGQMLTALMSAQGDRVTLLDPHADRRARALRAGAATACDVPVDQEALDALRARLGDGSGSDLVIEAVGRPDAWRMAVSLARPGGEVVFHGGCPAGSRVDLPTGPLHYSELTLRGSYHHTPDVFREAIALLQRGDIAVSELLLNDPIGLADVPHVLEASRGHKYPVMPQLRPAAAPTSC
jgi:L-iditol 2-dehydrogenase